MEVHLFIYRWENNQAIGMKEFPGQDLGELGKAIMLKTILLGKPLTVCRRKGVMVELLVREEENCDSFSLREEELC